MSLSDSEVLHILQSAGQGNPAATQRMMQIQSSPDYYTALAHIVAEQSIDTSLRQMAALQIKTGVTNPACVQNSAIQQSILNAIGDAHPQIRKIMATVIARGVASGAWPMGAIDYLTSKMQQEPTPEVTSGCVRALTYITEDLVEALDASGQAHALINLLVPLIVNSDPDIRDNALLSCCVFIEQAGMRNDGACFAGLQPLVTNVLRHCLGLLHGQGGQLSNSSMFNCVKILVLSMTFNEEVMPDFATLADMMNSVIQNDQISEDIRTEALQFWKAVLYFPNATEAAKPYMERVIPMILRCMVYSPMELNMIGGKANDWMEADRPEDIKPRHFQGRSRNFHHEDEDEDGQNDDGDTDWNLRRSAASTIDEISQVYGDVILTLALSNINEMMQANQPWQQQEAAVLAIGAICEGCYDGLKSYMAAIIDRLLNIANDESFHHLARQICCWTIGQMNEFLLEKENANLLHRNLTTLLALMKSPTKSVQEAATSALQRLLEAALNSDNDGALQVEGYMRAIVETCSACLENYQLKNRQLLLECVESVCSYFGTELAIGETFGLLMTPLGRLWGETPDNSPLIFAYFECMASVCNAFGRAIGGYAQNIFDRTVAIILTHTQLRYNAKHSQQDVDIPDEEYLITALDLLSSLFDAMGSSLEPLLKQQPQLMSCIMQSMRDESPDIQKAAFALIGDLSGACPGMVQANLDDVCSLMLARLKDVDERRAGAASNVAWALAVLIEHQMEIGGLATLGPAHYEAFLRALGQLLVQTEFTTDMVNLAENVCLAIGCILVVDSQVLQRTRASLGFFASRWCEYVRNIKNVPLKDRALRGFLSAAQADPASLTDALLPLFDVCASVCHDAASDMKLGIRGLLQTLKTNAAGPWQNAMGKARPETKQKLHVAYGV